MSDNKKPRLCEVLGVEVNERFDLTHGDGNIFRNVYVDCEGIMRYGGGCAISGIKICLVINGELQVVRKPDFTPDEMSVVRLLKKAGYAKLEGEWNLDRSLPLIVIFTDYGEEQTYRVLAEILPSIKPGVIVNLDELDLEDEA